MCRGMLLYCFLECACLLILFVILFLQARRTESSLKLLQQRSMRKPGGPDAASTTVTDTDKITAQLFLDVQVRRSRSLCLGEMRQA